jgi:enoyl-CoA hydratase/carnithine racemase
MTAQLKSHSQGQTLVLTISNPEHRNALDPAMYSAGVEALNVAETNPDVKSVILTGEGAHFCAGGNLNRILANRTAAPDQQAEGIDALHSWIEAIRTFPKPVIAAVEGAAAGATPSTTKPGGSSGSSSNPGGGATASVATCHP